MHCDLWLSLRWLQLPSPPRTLLFNRPWLRCPKGPGQPREVTSAARAGGLHTGALVGCPACSHTSLQPGGAFLMPNERFHQLPACFAACLSPTAAGVTWLGVNSSFCFQLESQTPSLNRAGIKEETTTLVMSRN